MEFDDNSVFFDDEFLDPTLAMFPLDDAGEDELINCQSCNHLRASVSLALSAQEELVMGKYVPRSQMAFVAEDRGRNLLSEMIFSFKDAHARLVRARSLLCFQCAKKDAELRAQAFTGVEGDGVLLDMVEREAFGRAAWSRYYQLMNPFNDESGDDNA
jgi:hypothetical protein